MRYHYKVGNSKGKVIEDYIDANNEKEAINLLEEKGYMIFEIKKEKKTFSFFSRAEEKRELLAFTRMFYILLRSGLEISDILETLIEQIENAKFKNAVINILKNVRSGYSLADAMRAEKRYFKDFYIMAIDAGEKIGALENTFNRIYGYLQNSDKIANKVKTAMIYPVFLLCFSIIVVLYLTVGVLPAFSKVYSSFGKDLPLITKMVMAVSEFIIKNWYYIIAGLIVSIFLGIKLLKNKAVIKRIDYLMMKIDFTRNFLYKQEIVSLFQTLALSIESGMQIIKALKLAGDGIKNSKIREDFSIAIDDVSRGENLSKSLSKIGFPRIAIQMVHAGEQSNNLEEMLNNVGEFYQEELENFIAGLMTFMEPFLILVVGILVGTLIIAIVLPIMSLSTTML